VKSLSKQTNIKNAVFAFRLDSSTGASFMDLGSYNQDPNKQLKWFNNQPYS
jgi:hypothetical protein